MPALGTTPQKTTRSVASRVLWTIVWTGLGLVALVVGLFLWVLHDVTTPDDGDNAAAAVVDSGADEIADGLESRYDEPLDAENLAQRAVDLAEAEGYDVTVLGWSGSSGEDGGARVELAISADVEARSSDAIFGDSTTAGSATSCWAFVVRAYEHDDVADRERIGCPDEPAPVTPDPTPLPSLGPDAEADLLAVVDGLPADATAEDAEQAARAAFPEFVDVRAERAGAELVATVGVVRSRDCVVAVRPDGEPAWRFSDFPRIQLEPGEGGCGPGLYLSPVTTH